jgi:hypothetical protein
VVLEDKDVIRVDATIIAGILILLTLSSIGFGIVTTDRQIELRARSVLTLSSIIFFAISGIFAALPNLLKKLEEGELMMFISVIFMISGLAYLVGVISFFIAVTNLR